jgi:hypothetical protein
LDYSAYVAEPVDPDRYVLHATLTTVPTHGFKGSHYHGVVATFTLDTPDPDAKGEEFIAYAGYAWGALANFNATVVRNEDGSFSVVADFDAVETLDLGKYYTTISVMRGQRSAQQYWAVDVGVDPTLAQIQPKNNLSFRQRQEFTTTVATFTAPPNTLGTDVSPGRFTATIDWGDGHVTAGVITKNWDGTFDISGTNAYRTKYGYVPIRVSLTDLVTGRTVSMTSGVSLDHDPVELTAGKPEVSTGDDGVVSGTLATFVDEDGPSKNPDEYHVSYATLIDWGDGQISAGEITLNEDGSYSINSTHAYAVSGDYTVSVLVRRNSRYAPRNWYSGDGADVRVMAMASADFGSPDLSNEYHITLHLSVRRGDGPAAGGSPERVGLPGSTPPADVPVFAPLPIEGGADDSPIVSANPRPSRWGGPILSRLAVVNPFASQRLAGAGGIDSVLGEADPSVLSSPVTVP